VPRRTVTTDAVRAGDAIVLLGQVTTVNEVRRADGLVTLVGDGAWMTTSPKAPVELVRAAAPAALAA
jgi:hypothetical protein